MAIFGVFHNTSYYKVSDTPYLDKGGSKLFEERMNFDPNRFEFSGAQKDAVSKLIKTFISKNISCLKNCLQNIVVKAGCDERNANQRFVDLDKSLANKNDAAVTRTLNALGVTADADIEMFMKLAGKSDPGEPITGNYSLHILRSMTMLKETTAAINASNLTKGQKEQVIRNIRVEITPCGITTKRGVNDPKGYAADRFNLLEIEPKSEWNMGGNETVEFLIDNSPSGAGPDSISASSAFLRDYVGMNLDLITGGAGITVTRFSGDVGGIDTQNKAALENDYKTFLMIDKYNISRLDITKEIKDNITGRGSSRERMLKDTIVKLNEIRSSGKKVDKVFVVSDEGFQKDLTLKNLKEIQSLKQSTGVKAVYFVIIDEQGVPNKIEVGNILNDLAKLNNGNEERAKETLFAKCAYIGEDGEVIRYSKLKGDELFEKSL
jgi:hypothetical protein